MSGALAVAVYLGVLAALRELLLRSEGPLTHAKTQKNQAFLRLADKRLGLLINFGEARIKDGIQRIVNQLPE